MEHDLPIIYRGFWDFPRIFITEYQGQHLLFDDRFDENLDDYAEEFSVFVLPPASVLSLDRPWINLFEETTHFLGKVSTNRVQFDKTRRCLINRKIVGECLNLSALKD